MHCAFNSWIRMQGYVDFCNSLWSHGEVSWSLSPKIPFHSRLAILEPKASRLRMTGRCIPSKVASPKGIEVEPHRFNLQGALIATWKWPLIKANFVARPGDKGHPPGFEPGSYGSEPILNHYATQTCIKVGKIANYDHGLGLERGTENQKDNAQQLPTCSIRPNKHAPKTPPINKTTQITPKPFPIIQKPSETSVSGNSTASTYWKQSFWVKRESPQKKTWNQCDW